MTLSQATLVQRVRRVLEDNPFETYDVAGVASTSADTNLDVPDSSKFAVGNVVEWQDNGEQGLVKQIVDGNTVLVKRAHRSTTVAAHAANVVLLKDPVFQYVQITDALDRCINSLWPYAWKKVADSITPSTATWYDLAAEAIDLIAVRQVYGTLSDKVALYGARDSGLPVQFERMLPTALVASGNGLRFPRGFAHTSNTVHVDYRAKITTGVSGGNYSDLDDNLLAEALVFGAAARMVGSKEVPRVTQDDTSMGDATVAPQSRLMASTWLEGRFRAYLNNYYDELMRTIPPMKKWSR